MKRYCPACGKESEWMIVDHPVELSVRGEKITVGAEFLRCPECGAEYEDLNSEIDPYVLAYNEYRRRKGMVQPEEIKTFRKRYGLTQKELSRLLGLGDITLSRYENGSLQDEVHDNLLRLAMQPQNLSRLIAENPHALPEKKKAEVMKIINAASPLFQCIQSVMGGDRPNIENGFKTLDLYKVTQVIKFFCHNREVFKTKLLKLLFYVDFIAFKVAHRSVTGLKYARLPHGPVPDNFNLILGAVLQSDDALQAVPREIGQYNGEVFLSFTPPDLSVFSEEERKVMAGVNKQFDLYTSRDISSLSHNEKGYRETPHARLIPYSYAEHLELF